MNALESKKFQIFSTIMCRKYMYLFTDQALLEKYLQSFVELIFSQRENSTLFTSVYNFEKYIGIRECVRAGARTRRSLGHHLLHPLILRLLVLCAPAVLRPRALQDAPAPADPNS